MQGVIITFTLLLCMASILHVQARSLRHPLAMEDFGDGDEQRLSGYLPMRIAPDRSVSGYNFGEKRGLSAREAVMRMRRAEENREKELKQLYNTIAREFPFLAKQGLKQDGKVPSLDDLFSMTVFGQPRAH